MKYAMTITVVTALVAGMATMAFAEGKKHPMGNSMMTSSTELVTGTNPGAQSIDGPDSAKNTERNAQGYSTTTGQTSGPRGGSVNPNPRVMGRETR